LYGLFHVTGVLSRRLRPQALASAITTAACYLFGMKYYFPAAIFGIIAVWYLIPLRLSWKAYRMMKGRYSLSAK